MTADEVKRVVGDLPAMTLEQARTMTQFIHEHRVTSILELGFWHGVSTCYMAAALGERGGGSITAIDLEAARAETPNAETLLERIGERPRATIFYEPTSYTWRLMKMIEEDPAPRFDLCYLDGAHSWFVDGLAFFLVDRLLKPEGWIILDDLDWTFAASPTIGKSDWVMKMPAEEKTTAQVRKVYELLVRGHPAYGNFRVEGGWAFAQKRAGEQPTPRVETEVRIERIHVGLGGLLLRIARKILGR